MTYSEVKVLLDAGFTADEIRGMINSQNPQINPQTENTNIPEHGLENNPENIEKDQPGQLDPDSDEISAASKNTNNDSDMEKRINSLI